MPELFPIIVIIIVWSLVANVMKKAKGQKQRPQRPAAKPAQTATEKTEQRDVEELKYDFQKNEPFCQASGEEEQHEWESMESNEGEEFDGHDHGSQVTYNELETEDSIITDDARDMLKGIVWSEILSRKKR